MALFNFQNFFTLFLEFSFMRQEGSERNDNFYFLPFSSQFNIFWLEMGPEWYFLIFLLFFEIFYYSLRRNETERHQLFTFFLGLFQPILALNEAIMVFFYFQNLFAIFFWNFQLRVRYGRNETLIFIFSLSHPLSWYFGLK